MAERKYIKSFDIYRRGKVAAQFKLQPDIERPGVFVDLTDKAKGDGFDWADKVTIKLGVNDLCAIASGLSNGDKEIKLFHDPGAGTEDKGSISKNISFTKSTTGYFMNVSIVKDRKPLKRISVAMSPPEIYALIVLFEIAIPKILRWN